ncbi:MAG: Ig-like domain-containing protein [Ignavibacteriae bacterium]|nr:Ig-like domain-containing protein [Ignavibacteriota bacterium]
MDALIRIIQIASLLRTGGALRRLSGVLLFAAMMLTSSGFGQNLNNNGGTINNLGTIRVKGNASNLPPVDGIFEYFGDNQLISATQYRNLQLTGSGTKTTTGGSFTVLQNIVIVPAVTLQVEPGATVNLMGNLIENGYLSGSISKTIDLSGGTTTSNYGNLGLTLSWSGTAPESTTVNRVSGVASTGNGNQSILRYYDVTPKVNSNLDMDIVFAYASSELNGLDENTLELWRSIDGGTTWRRQGGTVNTTLQTITLSGVKALSRWTASDVTNPLGSTAYEWIASQADSTSGGGQSASPGSTLAPFVVTVTDAYGNPIAGVNVTFALSSLPPGATGTNLSVVNATTDADGQVSTALTLGNLNGTYTVTATATGLAGSPVSFSATATGSSLIASSIVKVSGDAQQDTVDNMLAPFTVRVLTSGGDPVPGVPVEFAITGAPLNATGQLLSVDSVVTDVNGEASTILTLGNKVGNYAVTATPTPDTLSGSPVTFTATATNGVAATMLLVSGNNQSGTVNQPLAQPVTVAIHDAGGNNVPNHTVNFAISQVPSGATGQSLSDAVVMTDSNGIASTILTLGSENNTYTVTATSTGLANSPVTFTATASGAAAAVIQVVSGDDQSTTVLTPLPDSLVVVVLSAGGNPIAGDTVNFGVQSVPTGATGSTVSAAFVVTDSQGRAAVQAILGDKAGEYVFSATRDGLQNSPIMFSASATSGEARSITELIGNGQSNVILTPLTDSLAVVVRDSTGNPVQGVAVTFALQSVPAGTTGQQLSTQNAVTNANGIASTQLTLGNKVGQYIVTAASAGLTGSPLTFSATATHGAAASIAEASGNDQSAIILTQLSDSLAVVVRDIGGNVVPGTAVAFAVQSVPTGATGQQLSALNAITDSNGIASTRLTLGNKVGPYNVTATSSGLTGSPVTFSATALPGNVASVVMVSGNNQEKPILTTLDTAFVVRVLDVGQNTVPNAAVVFAITDTPNGATGQSLSEDTVITSVVGEAATVLTLGNEIGEYQVTAFVQGVDSVVFVARTEIIVGDPNNDANINIADLTQVIDHVIGKTMLTGTDSVQADVNRDSTVDILDVEMIKQHLLGVAPLFEGPSVRVSATGGPLSLKVQGITATVEGEFEPTDFGLRFSLLNNVPVKGIQIVLKFRTQPPADLGNAAITFSRASAMAIPIHVSGNEVRLVASNNDNTPIEPGAGAIFRMPSQLKNLDDVEEMELLISTGEVVHQAVGGSIQIGTVTTVPLSFKLEQNFPNPFNPNTTIEFEVPDSPTGFTPVTIEIFNQLGAKVKTLVFGEYEAGRHRVIWNSTDEDGSPSATGVYYYRLVSGSFRSAKKMLLLK